MQQQPYYQPNDDFGSDRSDDQFGGPQMQPRGPPPQKFFPNGPPPDYDNMPPPSGGGFMQNGGQPPQYGPYGGRGRGKLIHIHFFLFFLKHKNAKSQYSDNSVNVMYNKW